MHEKSPLSRTQKRAYVLHKFYGGLRQCSLEQSACPPPPDNDPKRRKTIPRRFRHDFSLLSNVTFLLFCKNFDMSIKIPALHKKNPLESKKNGISECFAARSARVTERRELSAFFACKVRYVTNDLPHKMYQDLAA